jgi:hypothetical protein
MRRQVFEKHLATTSRETRVCTLAACLSAVSAVAHISPRDRRARHALSTCAGSPEGRLAPPLCDTGQEGLDYRDGIRQTGPQRRESVVLALEG